MSESQGTLVLVALFGLRCIIPLAATMLIGYLMNRLVDRWQAEDAAQLEGEVVAEGVDIEPALKPAFGLSLPVVTLPCWITKKCDPAKRDACPAHKQPGMPCWLARLRAEGMMPADCPDCPIYARAMCVVN